MRAITKRRWRLRTAASTALAGVLLVSAGTPASAQDDPPDTTAPVVTDIGITDGRLIPSSIDFRPVVTDNVAVVRAETEISGVFGVRRGTCAMGAGRMLCRVSALRTHHDKDATVTLRVFDAAGNRAEASARVHIDSEMPGAVTSPARGSSVRTGPVAIELTQVSADTVQAVMFDGATGARIAARTEGSWTFSWDAVNGAVPPYFVLTDRAGNQSWAIATDYVVDDEAPVIKNVVFSGQVDSVLDSGAGWVGGAGQIVAHVEDESFIAGTEWRVNGVLASTGQWFDWSAAGVKAPTAGIEVRVRDAAGNTAAKSFTVSIDRTAPAVTVSPAERTLVRGATFVVSMRASDPHGVALSGFRPPNPYTVGGATASLRVRSGLDGPRTVTAWAVDNLNNEVSVRRTVIVDNTAPALTVTKAPKNGSRLTKTAKLTVAATDRNGVARVQLLVNGKVVSTDSRAGFAFTLNPKKYGKKFTVQLRAYDRAGNVKYSGKRNYRR